MIGLVNVIAISTSSPVAGPSPLVVTLSGRLLMPFTTVLFTRKLAFSTPAENVRLPELLARVAESISTSAGELAREGTLPEGGLAESRGKTWYTSISTSLIFSRGVPNGTNPTILACLMTVVCCRIKSSAVSVSSFPGLARRDAAPSRPSGVPVVKEKGAAHKDVATNIPKASLAPVKLLIDLISLLVIFILFILNARNRAHAGLYLVRRSHQRRLAEVWIW